MVASITNSIVYPFSLECSSELFGFGCEELFGFGCEVCE